MEFQELKNEIIKAAIKVGFINGTNTFANISKSDAPSILAEYSNSFGNETMFCLNKYMRKGRDNAVKIIIVYVSKRPIDFEIRKVGITRLIVGTIIRRSIAITALLPCFPLYMPNA